MQVNNNQIFGEKQYRKTTTACILARKTQISYVEVEEFIA